MSGEAEARRLIETAGGDIDRLPVGRLPEQLGAAFAAEPSPRLGRRLIPAQILDAVDGHAFDRQSARIAAGRAMLAAALAAMAEAHRIEGCEDAIADGTAQAAAGRPGRGARRTGRHGRLRVSIEPESCSAPSWIS